MKFFLDENITPLINQALRAVYKQHTFDTPWTLQLKGVEDIQLFQELATKDFDFIITSDLNQLRREDERQALLEANLSWIGVPQVKYGGLALIASMTSLVFQGVQYVLTEAPKAPTAYHLVSPRQANGYVAQKTPLHTYDS